MLERWHLIFLLFLQLLSKVMTVVTIEIDLLKRSCCTEDTKYMNNGDETHFCVSKSDDNLRYELDINCTASIIIISVTEIDDLDSLADYCVIENNVGNSSNSVGNNTFLIGKCKQEEWQSNIDIFFVPVSVVCLFVTMIVYMRIGTLRQPEDIAFIIFVLLLTVFLSLKTTLVLFGKFINESSQEIIMFIKYYTNLGSFVWINVILVCQLRKNM